ncbi:MAG: class II D-tagatose-bisphosphate aldolase, non-catalytic subunit, partial [Spirochaetales bacterium]|nr:class II D-tagatose-bisphosphate aldolase, non-catalytic subunit [Spirochaetales bacterium]
QHGREQERIDRMKTLDFFTDLIEAQNRGDPRGIYSICSAHPRVIAAAMAQARADELPFLVESTVNQVNQFGGYTGMKPAGFRDFVFAVAGREGFPGERIMLGADHLGPYPWRREAAGQAMQKACELVASCVKAGYAKIHLDASMPLGGDPVDEHGGLEPELVARREAQLAAAAEAACRDSRRAGLELGGGSPPVYVIGTDVPAPGGVQSQAEAAAVTHVRELEQTIASCRREFEAGGLEEAWQRVVAVVVQPGVEFGEHVVYPYERARAGKLISAARRHTGLLLEAHSTDHQRPGLLRQLVEDRFAVLKVGPALTFAMRECLFALESMEKELLGGSYRARLSRLELFLEKAMSDNPSSWQSYHTGSAQEVYLARKYSFSDRSRYYWQVPMVKGAVELLLENMRQVEIPLTLISQYLPRHYREIREGRLNTDPEELIEASIRMVLRDYSAAAMGFPGTGPGPGPEP